NLEYGVAGLSATALRIRDHDDAARSFYNTYFWNNTFVATTDAQGVAAACGAIVTKKTVSPGGPIVIRQHSVNAYVTATNDDASDWSTSHYNAVAFGISGAVKDAGLEIMYNNFSSDDNSLRLGDADSQGAAQQYVWFIGNSLTYDDSPGRVTFGLSAYAGLI